MAPPTSFNRILHKTDNRYAPYPSPPVSGNFSVSIVANRTFSSLPTTQSVVSHSAFSPSVHADPNPVQAQSQVDSDQQVQNLEPAVAFVKNGVAYDQSLAEYHLARYEDFSKISALLFPPSKPKEIHFSSSKKSTQYLTETNQTQPNLREKRKVENVPFSEKICPTPSNTPRNQMQKVFSLALNSQNPHLGGQKESGYNSQ